jgi:hypothetical protein
VIGRGIRLACLLGLALACRPQPSKPTAATPIPQMRATVVTIRTTTAPANKRFTHAVVIADGKARIGNEVDRWRLFDFKNKRVVFVDELSKSYHTATFDTLLQSRRKAIEAPASDGLARATIEKTANVRQIAGVNGTQYLIRMGRYERQLWMGDHPAIPASLFAMMNASQPESTPIGAVAREPMKAILELTGYPLVDHSELPYDGRTIAIERTVVKVEEKDVPAGWLDVPKGFKDATVVTAPLKGKMVPRKK